MRKGLLLLLLLVGVGRGEAETLAWNEFYTSSVLGLKMTPRLLSLAGHEVSVTGFMAPPLRASGTFFVLTRQPVSLCPFCNSDADWPADILVIYLDRDQTFTQHNRPLVVTGRLEVGSFTDPETGFVSLVRLVGAHYRDS